MKKRLLLNVIIMFLFSHTSIFAQRQFIFHVQSQCFISTNQLQPLYQYSNVWGIVSPFEMNQALLLIRSTSSIIDNKNFHLNAGVSGVIKNYTQNSFLHEAFINTKIYDFIDFTIGKHAYSPLSYNDTIMVGGFMGNCNARPFPRVRIGIYYYYPLYIFNDFIFIKGGLSHGILNDNRTREGRSNSADNVH